MTGVPAPRPGISFFQRMFFVSVHSSGGFATRETPVPSGPRHWGQNLSPSAAESAAPWTRRRDRAGAKQVYRTSARGNPPRVLTPPVRSPFREWSRLPGAWPATL